MTGQSKIFFNETQRYTQWWLWAILLGLNGMFLSGVVWQVGCGRPIGNNPISNTGLLIVTGITIILTLIFRSIRLETMIKADGICVRFFPFHLRYTEIPWEQITKSYIRPYSPVSEYGGWGIRFSITGKGTAYNISGKTGLQLEFANNKKLLIGTNKQEELIATLHNLGQSGETENSEPANNQR